MRSDNATFAAANLSANRKPRYTIVIDFSTDGTDLVYLTSHAAGEDAVPGGLTQDVDYFPACIRNVSGTSQRIDPLKGSATIGNISFDCIDNGITDLLSTKNAAGKGTRRKRVQVYVGFEGMAWVDYELRHTYWIEDFEFNRGVYSFDTEDIQRQAKKEIFVRQRYHLRSSVSATDTKLYVDTPDTTYFPTFPHDAAYTDNPAIITTACSVTVAASVATFALSSGSFPEMVVGQTFTTAGFTTAGNNADFVVTSYSATSITAAAGSAATEAAGDTVTISPHVGYVRLEDTKEVVRHAGLASDGGGNYLIVAARGALGTTAVAHDVDAGVSDDRKTDVIEWPYIEGPGPLLAYNIETGTTYPAHWTLGIDTDYVTLADFQAYPDLYDTSDVTAGRQMRFEGMDKVDGKKFIEEQIMLWLGCFQPVYSNGALGFKKRTRILAGGGYLMKLDASNLTAYGALKQVNTEVLNRYLIRWNYVPNPKFRDDAYYSRETELIDASSQSAHQESDPYEVEFLGVHTSANTDNDLRFAFDSLRDSFAGPPLRQSVEALPVGNVLEVGDTVRLDLETVQDPVAGAALDRVFEIQQVQTDWRTGNVKLDLFGSSAAPGALTRTAAATVISDGWYTGSGTNLASVLTISGGAVTANGSLTGASTLAGARYYYDGDLTIGAGVDIDADDNVMIAVRGFFQVDGKINIAAAGHAGGTGQTTVANNSTNGTAGYWSTQAGGGVTTTRLLGDQNLLNSFTSVDSTPNRVNGTNVLELFEARWDGTDLTPLPTDLRGSSGGGGRAAIYAEEGGSSTVAAAGSNGGAGGGGLLIVSRGGAFGAAGSINVSGGDAGAQNSGTAFNFPVYGGTGAPGMQGAVVWMIDGNNSAPDLVNNVTAIPGTATFNTSAFRMPATGSIQLHGPFISQGGLRSYHEPTIAFEAIAHAAASTRVQYVVPDETVEAEVEPAVHQITAPSAPTLSTTPLEPKTAADAGAVLQQIKVTVAASTDPDYIGTQIQAKRNSESDWQPVSGAPDPTQTVFYFQGTQGVQYNVRARYLSRYDEGHSDWSSTASTTASASTVTIGNPGAGLPTSIITVGTSGDVQVGAEAKIDATNSFNGEGVYWQTFFESLSGFSLTDPGGLVTIDEDEGLEMALGTTTGQASRIKKNVKRMYGDPKTWAKSRAFKTRVKFDNSLSSWSWTKRRFRVGIGDPTAGSSLQFIGFEIDEGDLKTLAIGASSTLSGIVDTVSESDEIDLRVELDVVNTEIRFYADDVLLDTYDSSSSGAFPAGTDNAQVVFYASFGNLSTSPYTGNPVVYMSEFRFIQYP